MLNANLDVQFCDDIRQEVNNKFSLVGCYFNDMVVPSFPVAILKFCAHFKLSTPRDLEITSLKIKLVICGEIVSDVDFSPEHLVHMQKSVALNKPDGAEFFIMGGLESINIEIQGPGDILLEATINSTETLSRKLRVIQLETAMGQFSAG